MQIVKRNGTREPADLNKIVNSATKTCVGLDKVDVMVIATKTISGLFDGATTEQIDNLTKQVAVDQIAHEPQYSKAGARFLMNIINKEVENGGIESFSQAIAIGHKEGLIGQATADFVKTNARKLNHAINAEYDNGFEYFGLQTVYDRYLLKHPTTRRVIETPQYWLLRVACGIFDDVKDAIAFYNELASFRYMTSSPTSFNSGTKRPQMSSCYLLKSPTDDLGKIYKHYGDIAQLSKWAGGIGSAYSEVRGAASLIKGTNGFSNGIVPFLHTLDASVSSVNQGGKRKGAAAVYLESWHSDIEEFLRGRDNTRSHDIATHNLNLANWIPDELMRRVDEGPDTLWTLFSPGSHDPEIAKLNDLHNEAFDIHYKMLEEKYDAMEVKPKWYKKIKAHDLYGKMMKTLSETGNGWMNWKDRSNKLCNQVTDEEGYTVHSSNLCTEIIEVTNDDEVAVCNLGSVNLAKVVFEDKLFFDETRTLSGQAPDKFINWKQLEKTVKLAVRGLDKVIDVNFYPIQEAENSNKSWRPVGLGIVGWQDLLFKLRIPFDDVRALGLAAQVQAFIYYVALQESLAMAKEFGPLPNFNKTKTAKGLLQPDLWGVVPVGQCGSIKLDWDTLREEIKTFGLRNSLMIAIAPTATLATIVGAYECIEPQVKNIFKRETLSGEFMQVNTYLVNDLMSLGMWNTEMRNKIIDADGAIQNITEIPADLRALYATAFELKQKSLIDQAVARGPYIDQSQSLNLFMENPTIGKLSSMYMYAWKQGLKTTYYLRSRSATKIQRVTTTKVFTDAEAVACSLENPEICEACT